MGVNAGFRLTHNVIGFSNLARREQMTSAVDVLTMVMFFRVFTGRPPGIATSIGPETRLVQPKGAARHLALRPLIRHAEA